MADNMNKELFLDILTKDEREALLTKKMEEIRKKNEALRKRHEEIEADKRVAAKDNPNKDVNSYSREAVHSGSTSPRKETKPLPGEEKRGSRASKSGGRGRSQGGGKTKEKRPQGPPPDPSYNFLADRRREGTSKEAPSNMEYHGEKNSRKGETRRHPKNYGGQDFNNVKAQIRSSKERQERPKSGPPRTKMELAMSMTGKERKQYMEWKAERERVDLERLERQKSNTGEWRRAWDADKNKQDFEQPPSPQRTEPAKRPAGRIGSGRFDRGEREERQRGDAPRQKGVKPEQEAQIKPIGRGRARGRGRGRGRGDRSPRQRTFSSGDESRKVERQKDLLVVKIDNSGKDTNQSVEVEYWDDDLVDVKSNSAASVKSGTSSRDGHSKHARTHHHDDHQFDDLEDGQDGDNGYVEGHQRRYTHSHSLGDENEHDESWEDCPEDAEFYGEEEYGDGDDRYKEPLKLECKLNPDAPEFTPTSPEFMKTPPGHVKVMDWVTEVNSNLSPTSPPPTMDGVNSEECKKALFKNTKSNSAEKQSSFNGGVKQSDIKTSEEEISASYPEDNEPNNTAAPDEFLDASGDMGEHDESQVPDQDGSQEAESLNVSGKMEEEGISQIQLPVADAKLPAETVDTAVDSGTPVISSEENINACSLAEDCDADVDNEKLEEDAQGCNEIASKSLVGADPNTDKDTATTPSAKAEELSQTTGSASSSLDADASEKPTDKTADQMARSDMSSQSDHIVQSQQLVLETEPTEGNSKSSVPETVVQTTSPPPTRRNTDADEDSHVE